MPDFKYLNTIYICNFKFTVDNNFVFTVFELNAISEFKISARCVCVYLLVCNRKVKISSVFRVCSAFDHYLLLLFNILSLQRILNSKLNIVSRDQSWRRFHLIFIIILSLDMLDMVAWKCLVIQSGTIKLRL